MANKVRLPAFYDRNMCSQCKYVYRWYPAECEEKTGQKCTAVIATFVVVSSHPLLGRMQWVAAPSSCVVPSLLPPPIQILTILSMLYSPDIGAATRYDSLVRSLAIALFIGQS